MVKLTGIIKPRRENSTLPSAHHCSFIFFLRQTLLINHCTISPPSRLATASEPFSPTVHGGSWPGIHSLLPSCLVAPWCLFLGHPLLPGTAHHSTHHLDKTLQGHCLFPPKFLLHLQEVPLLLPGTVDSHPCPVAPFLKTTQISRDCVDP